MNHAKLLQIIDLLELTIERKRKYAQDLRDDTLTSMGESLANRATAAYVDINVEELEKIVIDLKSVL